MRRLVGQCGLLAALLVACSVGDPAAPTPVGAAAGGISARGGDACTPDPAVTTTTVKDCIARGQAEAKSPGPCLDQAFGAYLKTHTPLEALAMLQCFEDTDPDIKVGCHPIAHAIGRAAFVLNPSVDRAFAACDQTCHSGCYHGVMERFLRGDADEGAHISIGELQAKAATACSPDQSFLLRFQCLHGLGHAVTYYTKYDLDVALTLCDATGDDWSQGSCWGGVFMENIAASDPKMRKVSATDPHYPCNAINEKYKAACYIMQTSRMSEMGLSSADVLLECRKAGPPYDIICVESLGRDLSNGARVDGAKNVSATCERGQGEEVSACTRGVIRALIDNTWDARYAFPYCATYASGDHASYCFQVSAQYLAGVYSKTPADIAAECDRHVPGNAACKSAAGL